MYKRPEANILYCFSPAVMLLTIAIELSLAAWVVSRYVIQTPQRIILGLLVFLAAFQIAEYNVCTSDPAGLIWSRIGYVFITALPALSLDLVVRLRGNRQAYLAQGGYMLAALFIIAFTFLPSSLNAGVCTGNYVIFLLTQPLSALYGLYYLGLELIGLVLSFLPAPKAKLTERKSLTWMGLAYLGIMVPSFILYWVIPATKVAIPSIMCGFAVIFALITALRVAPLISKAR